MSKLIRAISENGGAVVSILDSTDIVAEVERLHHPSAVVSAALGRLVTGAVLMAATLKNDEDALTLRVKGDGPAGLLLAVVSLLTENVYGAAVLGILAFSCFWSIRELFEQEQRVRKGWFPKKEKRKEQ